MAKFEPTTESGRLGRQKKILDARLAVLKARADYAAARAALRAIRRGNKQ